MKKGRTARFSEGGLAGMQAELQAARPVGGLAGLQADLQSGQGKAAPASPPPASAARPNLLTGDPIPRVRTAPPARVQLPKPSPIRPVASAARPKLLTGDPIPRVRPPVKRAAGGSVRGNGCASKGHTKGKMR